MKYFLYLLLIFSSIVYADNKISAPYDDQCDNKIETFHKINDLEISDRYEVSASLKLNRSTDLYILDRTFSSNKPDNSCQYTYPDTHRFLFIKKNKNYSAILNNKLLSNLDGIHNISLDKNSDGFSISIWYGQGTTALVGAIFKVISKKGIFLKKVTYQKIVPVGEDDEKDIQKFPQSNKYELSNIVLSDFF